jgi:hypothetical protein
MHAVIRATSDTRFPAVERFRELKLHDAYNSPAWVADHILRLAFEPGADPPPIVLRVPHQPRPR